MEQMKLFEEKKTDIVSLKSYPDSVPYRRPVMSDLVTRKVEPKSPRSEYRNMFGASLSMDRINSAIQSAYQGDMEQICDLSRETIDTDPHLASVLQKRFANVSTLPWAVVPASGHGVDKDKALFYAEVVREQVQNLHNFRQVLKQFAWAIFDGRCASENIWIPIKNGQKMESGRPVWVALDKINWIHPRLLSFDNRRDLVVTDGNYGFLYWENREGITLNEDLLKAQGLWGKFNWWLPQSFGEYPEREGLALRCLYWSFFKRFAARDRLILLELFGKPLRYLEVDEDSSASDEDIEAARTAADAIGSYFSAQMPRGVHMNFYSPGEMSGQNYEAAIETSNRELSKLVLGQIGTTDGVKAGLNSSTALVMQDTEYMVLRSDAEALSEVIEDNICDRIIELNFGQKELIHAPRFKLKFDVPADRGIEIDRLQKALTAGMEISLEEAYEISGFRVPDDGESRIRIDQPPTPPTNPTAPASRPLIVMPSDGDAKQFYVHSIPEIKDGQAQRRSQSAKSSTQQL